MAITRQVSSDTLVGLSEQVSLAVEDKLGVDESGKSIRITGTGTGEKETDVLGFTWGQSTTEITQAMTFNISELLNQAFTGVTGRTKSESITLKTTAGHSGTNVTVTITVGTVSGTISLAPLASTISATAAATAVASELKEGIFGDLIETVVVNGGTSINITYTSNAGNIATPTVTVQQATIGSLVASSTVNREFSVTTKARKLSAYTINISAGATGTLTPRPVSKYLNIAAGASLTRSSIINLSESVFNVNGINSVSTNGTTMTITLDSGYSFGNVALEVLIDPTDGSSRLFGVDFPATQTIAHTAAVAETHGDLKFKLFNPTDNKIHDVSVAIIETDGIGTIVSKIVDGVNGHVYNTDGGKVSDFVTASSSNINNSAGTFDITLTWHEIGVVSTNSESTIIDKTSLVGTSLSTVAVSRSTVGTTYVLSAAPDWDLFSTSSTLQPGGKTTHFATLVKT